MGRGVGGTARIGVDSVEGGIIGLGGVGISRGTV